MKIRAHLITLPRWFATPAAVCGVVLGGLIAGTPPLALFVLVITGLCLMSWAHGMNTFLDYAWTKFDVGLESRRSRMKEYTAGQSIIELKVISLTEAWVNPLSWLLIGAIILTLGILYLGISVKSFIPFTLVALCTFWYSWAKLRYHPELPLGLGFGSFSSMFGASGVENPPFISAFLAGIPFTIMWGFCAESYDQWVDAEPNWPRGLRNIGAWTWRSGHSIGVIFLMLVLVSYISQVAIISVGILKPMSFLSLIAFPLFFYSSFVVEVHKKIGVIIGLLAIFLHMILLTVGQGIG